MGRPTARPSAGGPPTAGLSAPVAPIAKTSANHAPSATRTVTRPRAVSAIANDRKPTTIDALTVSSAVDKMSNMMTSILVQLHVLKLWAPPDPAPAASAASCAFSFPEWERPAGGLFPLRSDRHA